MRTLWLPKVALMMTGPATWALKPASMIDKLDIHVPVGEDGRGEYSAATKGCFDVIDAATPLVLKQVASIPLYPHRAFAVADYGTADAGTSLGLLTEVVTAIRQRQADKQVSIHYEDQASNEWKSVFSHALGNIAVHDAYGKAVSTPYSLGNVFVNACGIGFHSQCYPNQSIDLGVSFTAMHWLSAALNSLRGAEYLHAAQTMGNLAVAEQEQAAMDWDRILQARAAELTVGGYFVCVNFCVSKDGYFLGQTDRGASMWDSFAKCWNQLKDQGFIDEEERLAVSFPNYYRTTAEFVKGINAIPNLKLISAEEKIVRCPYREQYLEDPTKLTPRQYAESFVPTTRTWSNSIFRGALHADRTDKDSVLEQFWANYMALVEQNPAEHGMDYVHSYLVMEKTSE